MGPGSLLLGQNIGRGWPLTESSTGRGSSSLAPSIVRLAPPRRQAWQAGPRWLPSSLPSQFAETCSSCFSFANSRQRPSSCPALRDGMWPYTPRPSPPEPDHSIEYANSVACERDAQFRIADTATGICTSLRSCKSHDHRPGLHCWFGVPAAATD